MQLARPHFALHPARFGRGRLRKAGSATAPAQFHIGSDLKLFATTFVAGFLFVSMLIG
jgi:hypothetical protein